MTPKERVLTTFASQEPDRIPINYAAEVGIDRRLKKHLGLQPDDSEGLCQVLEVDFRGVDILYRGPRLHEDIPERGVKVDDWGIHRRWVKNESGGHMEHCDFPLQDADEETVADWPMPSPDDFDYTPVADFCNRNSKYALPAGSCRYSDVINRAGMLRGMEQTFIDLIDDDPAFLLLTKRRTDIQVEILRRTLEAANGGIDFLWMGEDLGTQIGPIISMEIYRKHIRPVHRKFVDLAKSFDIPVMIHTCGSSSWAYEEMIEMGIGIVDTLQPEARNMAPEYLKKMFGGRLAFHGCISTAGPVAYGSVDETVAYCENTLNIMMPGGGYCFAPTHLLQENSPIENVLAMYETAKTSGRY